MFHYEDVLTKLCAAAGKDIDEALLKELSYERQVKASWPFQKLDYEVVEIINELKKRRLKLGVVTNANNLDVASWPCCPLAPLFDDFTASYDVGLLKPDKRIYELSCERLSVSPDRAIFVGDGGANELCGAINAGLKAYWCTWFLDKWPEGIRPNGFAGDDWRQHSSLVESPYQRLMRPHELLTIVD